MISGLPHPRMGISGVRWDRGYLIVNRHGFTLHSVLKSVKNPIPYQIFIIDSHPVLADGLRALLEKAEGLAFAGACESVEAIPAAVRNDPPDVFMVDVYFKFSEALETLKHLQRAFPGVKVLVFSMHDEAFYAERTLQSGARGYIMMSEPSGQVLEAVRKVAEGHLYLSERLKSILFSQLDTTAAPHAGPVSLAPNPVKKLTNRELQVIELIGQGKDNREISDVMNIRLKTVEAYRFRIKDKLNLRHSTELIQFAIHWLQREDNFNQVAAR